MEKRYEIGEKHSLSISSHFEPYKVMVGFESDEWRINGIASLLSDLLPEALQYAAEKANLFILGTHHLILQSTENSYFFAKKVEQFLVLWNDFVYRKEGTLRSCYENESK